MLKDYIAAVLFWEEQSSQSAHVPLSCDLLLLPFYPLYSGIARKGQNSVTAEEAVGFPVHKLTPLISGIYYEDATRSSFDCGKSGSD